MNDLDKQLARAVQASDTTKCKTLLAQNADANTVIRQGDMLLRMVHVAVLQGDIAMCRLLADYGADFSCVAEQIAKGKTPLLMAAESGNAELCSLFLSHCPSYRQNPVFALLAEKQPASYEGNKRTANAMQHIKNYQPDTESLPQFQDDILSMLLAHAAREASIPLFLDTLLRHWAYAFRPVYDLQICPAVACCTGLSQDTLRLCFSVLSKKQIVLCDAKKQEREGGFLYMDNLPFLARTIPPGILTNIMNLLCVKRDTAFGHTNQMGSHDIYHIDSFVYFSGTRQTAARYLHEQGNPPYNTSNYEIQA